MPDGSGDAVEEEELGGREVAVRGDKAMDKVAPDLDGYLVGQKEPLACIIMVELAGGGLGG